MEIQRVVAAASEFVRRGIYFVPGRSGGRSGVLLFRVAQNFNRERKGTAEQYADLPKIDFGSRLLAGFAFNAAF
ncbi:hypothetical protein D3C81_1462080 [compost metagenome]